MNKLFCIILFLFSFVGCSMSTRGVATITANETRDIAAEENKVITKYCVPKYKEVKTKEDLKKVDNVCLKAQASYYAVRAAWKTLVLIIESSKLNKVTDQEVREAAIKLSTILVDLQQMTEVLK